MSATAAAVRIPPLFISHGGPNLYLTPEAAAYKFYKTLGQQIKKDYPALEAIVIVSAHWETSDAVRVNVTPKPTQIYDFYGFPKEMYEFKYHPKGHPGVANRVLELLQQAGVKALPDSEHGLDHGAWSPLSIVFPKADVPIVQVSLHNSMEPKLHLQIGAALAPLQHENVLIIGSGSVTHNFRRMSFFKGVGDTTNQDVDSSAASFEEHLTKIVAESAGAEREEAIRKIYSFPATKEAHPSAEHLAPIFVSVGAAGNHPGKAVYRGFMFSALSMTCYSF